ncbi:ABC transporter substrate-binding protein [Azospira sp. I13]|uniref:ABC transporter substrate-binding protein n=1 Tax=Azospira sp. I13 TaxID=1765050 RepID=UPI000D48E710|nr:ABC transporter substrate-binding protein [Azospira sp. I13]GBG02451.1 ABC transporter substrate-binding protein [Azospira sp. I13]
MGLAPLPALAGPQAPQPIRIGVYGPFTGGSSPMGISMRDGIRLAAGEINGAGGLLGRPVQLVERDDEAANQRGSRIAQELVQTKVAAAVGIVNTGVALASQHYFQEARIPVVTAVATGSIITKQFLPPHYSENYVFRVSNSDAIQAAMIVEEAVERRHFKRLAIIHDTTNYGQLGREDLEKALAAKGLKAVAVERFNLGEVDLTRQLQRARDAGAEAILTYGIGPELAALANGRAKLHWEAPLIGSWTLSMSSFIDNAGPNGEGARMPLTFIDEGTSLKRRQFIDAYLKATGSTRIPVPSAAAQGYDALLLLAAAIRQAGSTDGPRIKAALESLKEKVEGVVQIYDRPFSPGDHEAIDRLDVPVMGEVRGGRVIHAYSTRLRHAP